MLATMRRRTMLSLASLGLGVSLVLAACGSTATTASPSANGSTTSSGTTSGGAVQVQKGGTLKVDVFSSLSTADPQNSRTVTDLQLAAAIADPLLTYDSSTAKYVPMLATSWSVSKNGLTYTFHLRKGATFQDGEPIDASTIKWNLDRVVNPKNNLYAAADLAGVTAVRVVNPDTISIALKAVNADFLLSLANVRMVAPKVVGAAGANIGAHPTAGKPYGSGPFMIQSYSPDQQIVVTAYKNYYGGAPNLNEVVFNVVPDETTRELNLRSGSSQLSITLPNQDASALKQAGFKVQLVAGMKLARLVINVAAVPDVKVRQAICDAINQPTLLQHVYYGLGKPAYTFIYPGSWADSSQLQQVKYDPAQAKALLKQAAYVTGAGGIVTKNGHPLQLLMPSSPEADWLTATQVIQQMLKSVGIGTKITTAATQTYYSDVRTGHYDITWWLSNYAADPPVALTDMASTNYWNVWHMGAAANAPIDRLLTEGTSTLVQSKRAAIYQQLNNLVSANAYQCPGDWHDTVNGLSSKLHGVVVDPTGMLEMYQKWWLAK